MNSQKRICGLIALFALSFEVQANTNQGRNSQITGGTNNSIAARVTNSVIAGGQNNSIAARANNALIAGGNRNIINSAGKQAFIAGGQNNLANGAGAFAAGNRAQARHGGTFVWADGQNAIFQSTTNNQFLIRARRGVGINTNNPGTNSLFVNGAVRINGDLVVNSVNGLTNFVGPQGPRGARGLAGATGPSGATGAVGPAGATGRRGAVGPAGPQGQQGPQGPAGTAGIDNIITGTAASAIGGFRNTASAEFATVGGGTGNQATGSASAVGGGFQNIASGSRSTVAGGWTNQASGEFAAVSGGQLNVASGTGAFVGSGFRNTASGTNSAVVSGYLNRATAFSSIVSAGIENAADGAFSVVGGGGENTASGLYSVIPGGLENTASGNGSFAAGAFARATHTSSFVWGGSSQVSTDSFGVGTFTVAAPGGARFYSSDNSFIGPRMAAGGTDWVANSDSNLKTKVTAIDPKIILEKLTRLPVTEWEYKHNPNRRYIGPTAQDFHAVFGLGEDDKGIGTLDSDGVMYAAIQGLVENLKERDKSIEELKAKLEAVEKRLNSLPPAP
jgi:hypothetical protein